MGIGCSGCRQWQAYAHPEVMAAHRPRNRLATRTIASGVLPIVASMAG